MIISCTASIFLTATQYKSRENQRVVGHLIDEVQGLNQEFVAQHIRGSYLSACVIL